MRSRSIRIGIGTVVGVALASILMLSPAPAQAQGPRRGGEGGGGGGRVMMPMGPMGGRDLFEPPVNSAEVERYAAILSLSADQREAAKALLEASMAEFHPAARAAREKMEEIRDEFRETGDPSVWQGMSDVMEEFRKARSRAEAMFMDDLRLLLTDEQAQRWPTVERTHRRERTLSLGLMGGERVDLIKIVDRMDLAPADREAIAQTLEQYEIDLDRELVKRNALVEEGMGRSRELMEDFRAGDMTRARELFNKARDASRRVKEVNQRYARQIENLLPDGKRGAFTAAVKREMYPMVYRETYASRVLSAAEKIEDLDDAQRASLAAIRDSHARELAALNAQMEAAIEERENTADMMQMFGRGGRDEDLRRARRELDSATVQRVRDLLTEAQREKLPARNEGWEDDGPRFEPMGPRRRAGDGDGDDRGRGERPRRRDRRAEPPAPTTPPPPEPR